MANFTAGDEPESNKAGGPRPGRDLVDALVIPQDCPASCNDCFAKEVKCDKCGLGTFLKAVLRSARNSQHSTGSQALPGRERCSSWTRYKARRPTIGINRSPFE